MRHTKILAVIAGVLTCALVQTEQAQAGDVYKYVDEKGATLYTDKPIPGAVLVSTGAQRPPEVASRNPAVSRPVPPAGAQRPADAPDNSRVASTVARDLEATRAERCKKAREHYSTTLNSRRLYKAAPDGQRQYLTNEETDTARIEAAQQVEAICGPQG